MDSRAQFEAYWDTQKSKFHKDRYEPFKKIAWEAWQESRAAIEVELPEKISPHNTNESGYVNGQAAMYDEGIDDCAEAIRAVGISIKGNS